MACFKKGPNVMEENKEKKLDKRWLLLLLLIPLAAGILLLTPRVFARLTDFAENIRTPAAKRLAAAFFDEISRPTF